MAAKIKKGDTVIIRTGRDKGKSGEVTKMFVAENKVLVTGINTVKRHTKPGAAGNGGIITKEAPIHVSNVALIDPKDGKATRVGFKIGTDGKKQRIAKRSGEVISA